MDYDIYELSERERRVVFTALDLYREAAEKQLEAAEKKVRVYSHEIADLIQILNGDDLNWGLLHKFKPREVREADERAREERERKEREKRAQLGIFSEYGGQTVEEADDEDDEHSIIEPTAEEEHTIRSAALHFFRDDEAAQQDYVQGAHDAVANRFTVDGRQTQPYVRGHSLGRTLLEKRKRNAPPEEAEAPEPEDDAPDAIDELVDALKGDARPLTDYAELLSPTLISMLKGKGITTVGHVVERWAELPGITGVGKMSLGRLQKVLKEASSVATAGAAASAEDGALPF